MVKPKEEPRSPTFLWPLSPTALTGFLPGVQRLCVESTVRARPGSRSLGYADAQRSCHCGGYILSHTTSLLVPIIYTQFYVLVVVSSCFRCIIFVFQVDSYLLKDQGPQCSVYHNVELSAGGARGTVGNMSFSQITSSL